MGRLKVVHVLFGRLEARGNPAPCWRGHNVRGVSLVCLMQRRIVSLEEVLCRYAVMRTAPCQVLSGSPIFQACEAFHVQCALLPHVAITAAGSQEHGFTNATLAIKYRENLDVHHHLLLHPFFFSHPYALAPINL